MNGITSNTRRKEETLSNEEKLHIAEGNHIWLNAFTLVNPQPDLYEDIGRMVVQKLLESSVCDDLSKSFPVTWIRLNAS